MSVDPVDRAIDAFEGRCARRTRSRSSGTSFDPTKIMLAGNEDISISVAREQERASPLWGTWTGHAGGFSRRVGARHGDITARRLIASTQEFRAGGGHD